MILHARAGKELLTGTSGLALLGLQLQRSGLPRRFDAMEGAGRTDRTPGSTVVMSLCALIASGSMDYEAIEEHREDSFFGDSLRIRQVPAAATLRQRAEVLFGGTADEATPAEQVGREGACMRAERAVRDSLATMQASSRLQPTPIRLERSGWMTPVDMDTTVLEELYGKKGGVGCTYQKVLGYTPMLAYIGEEGYILDAELRPGVQHSQKGTPAAIRRARSQAASFVPEGTRLLWRFDSGCDSADTVAAVEECASDGYILVHNRRKETPARWLAIAQRRGVRNEPRPGKTVWIGETQRICGALGRRRCVFRVTRRTCAADGQCFLEPQIEVRLFWTNLDEKPEAIIELYAQHGTSEQFHAELKSDLGLEQFPSSDYRVNRVLFLLGCLVYNALRQIEQLSRQDAVVPPAQQAPLRRPVLRRRLRTVINNLFRCAACIVRRGRNLILSLGRGSEWVPVWLGIHRHLIALLKN